MIYLDYASTTPIDKDVLNTYLKVQNNFYANPSSTHKLGLESLHMLNKAKSELKEIFKTSSHEVVFTYNATEANNLAIFGVCNNQKNGKIITSKIEHPSVNGPIRKLEEDGFEVVWLDVDRNGQIDLEQLKTEIDKDTILVSIMWVNNIVGSIQPIGEIIKIVKKYPKAKLMVDAVQGICKLENDFDFEDIDIFTFSAHKIYGPKGVGCLIYKENISLSPVLFGAKASKSLKPGTVDIASSVACVKAVKKYNQEIKKHREYVNDLWMFLYDSFKNTPNIVINSPTQNNLPYIFNISVLNIKPETLQRVLSQNDIYVSSGSACSAKDKKPEPTVYAMSKSEELASHAIRISLSHNTTKSELQELVEIIKNI